MYYSRPLLGVLEKKLNTKEIVILTGMRRVGKTTLLKMIFDKIESKNKVFLDIENPINQKIFEETDYNNIWFNLNSFGINSKEKVFIFLDEVQAKPELVKPIKFLFDHYNVKFFLSGSSSFYLKNLFPESLAGRKVVLELAPLTFQEFLVFKGVNKVFSDKFFDKDKNKNKIESEKLKKLFEEYMDFGGFPQVVLANSIHEKQEALEDIFKSYFEKEVIALSDFRNMSAFRDILLLLLKRAGSKIDILKISSEVGISRETVYSYLSFLESTFFIHLIKPFTTNIDSEIRASKKIYLCDTGIARFIGNAEKGNLLENAVFLNLMKYGKINYYQKRNGAEIDFILQDKSTALEVKSKGTESDYRKLMKTAKELNLKQAFIITKDFSEKKGFIPATEL